LKGVTWLLKNGVSSAGELEAFSLGVSALTAGVLIDANSISDKLPKIKPFIKPAFRVN
jgi:hypothetical protein